MIIFKKVRWRNFVATGDYWNEVDLDRNKSTLIVGENGAGKSTMLDALSFGLFGKPFRSANKPELINSINKKQAVVEVEFDIGQHCYKVVRGMKPNRFEIWRDDEMFNESSHAKEFQKLLEQNILKLNHKSFHQIVVIGSSSFVPFMQLPAAARREIIEDLLDIDIFSKMNVILRQKMLNIKDQLRTNSANIDIAESKIKVQRSYIEDLKRINSADISSKRTRINDLRKEKEDLENQLDGIENQIEEDRFSTLINEIEKLNKSMRSLDRTMATNNNRLKELHKASKFFDDNDTCPTCAQPITDDISEAKKCEHKEEAEEIISKRDEYNEAHQVGLARQQELDEIKQELDSLKNNKSMIKSTISRIDNEILLVQNELSKANDNKDAIVSAHSDLEDMMGEKEEMTDHRLELTDGQSYNNAIAEMLKDGGIKTKIIKQYIPVMNTLINQYLQVLDFFVHFEMNQEFHETIRSRFRDNFTYGSFSEGEKQRIDLALLFTWRHIARMKNSVATNLLVLDETFDSSLDAEGTENLMKILDTLDDTTNAFVISHKGPLLEARFNHKIEFYKDKNFSRMR